MAKARKKVQPRKKTPARKRGTRRAKARARASASRAAAKQAVAISHYDEKDFDAGLRAYSAYRDLGVAGATNGKVRAHVIRMTKPFDGGEVAVPHYHDVEFQMVYVLKGWFETDLDGRGPVRMQAGSSWTQPPKIRHTVTGYSDDCELLEIILPADFDTVTLPK
ncbi:MAG: cupin domain-containing protein [Xanthobacteraceae bacterium]|uniref:cupin domain-containing protein n=1 Tax=Pseudolabrys sp. TaxID=1960880 RepID=UPI003D09B7F8